MTAAHVGRVVSFDEPRGLGEVEDAHGSRHPFHCSAVADGSRTIPVGTMVSYRIVAGRSGRWEAMDLVPTTAGGAPSR